MIRLATMGLFVLGAACTDVTGPRAEFENLRPYANPQLAETWREIESCSGLTGDYSRVHWYTATSISYKGVDGVRAFWRRRDNAIVLLESLKENRTIIEHEIMHALLQGGTDHPAQYFIDGPCGNLMAP